MAQSLVSRRTALLFAVITIVTAAACGRSFPTGATAQSEREILVTTYTAQWVAQLGMDPVPVSFVPSVRDAFDLKIEACGIVPDKQRRIVYDAPCMERVAQSYARWITAHEAAHIYYGDWKTGGGCPVEVRADKLASTLTGMSIQSKPKCYFPGGAAPIVPGTGGIVDFELQ